MHLRSEPQNSKQLEYTSASILSILKKIPVAMCHVAILKLKQFQNNYMINCIVCGKLKLTYGGLNCFLVFFWRQKLIFSDNAGQFSSSKTLKNGVLK